MADPIYIINVKNLNKLFDRIRAVINTYFTQVKKGEIFVFPRS